MQTISADVWSVQISLTAAAAVGTQQSQELQVSFIITLKNKANSAMCGARSVNTSLQTISPSERRSLPVCRTCRRTPVFPFAAVHGVCCWRWRAADALLCSRGQSARRRWSWQEQIHSPSVHTQPTNTTVCVSCLATMGWGVASNIFFQRL